ncbi:MAG: hypothetical protein V2B18_25740 [Pseudomonadota bacterium]
MPFTLQDFNRTKTHLYHLTFCDNLENLRNERRLHSASETIAQANQQGLMEQRRRAHVRLDVNGRSIWLRDQAPLHEGNIEFDQGCDMRRLVALLNGMVFFWPGNEEGAIKHGKRHYTRYRDENPAIVRAKTSDIIGANRENQPLFCRLNSGSPRCSGGHRSPRGFGTFSSAPQCKFRPSDVVEVTFMKTAMLPGDTQVSFDGGETWRSLFN